MRFLVVEDSTEDCEIFRRYLVDLLVGDEQVAVANTGREGLAMLGEDDWSCVLLDYRLPDIDGLEFLEDMRRRGGARELPPVVVLTGTRSDDALAIPALRAGAVDYLSKDEMTQALLEKTVRFAVERHALRRELERSRSERRRQEELQSLEELTRLSNQVTAYSLGQESLRHALPDLFERLRVTYAETLDRALEVRAYKSSRGEIGEDLKDLGDRLGLLKATPRDVVMLHSEALRERLQDCSEERSQVYVEEGRGLVLRLMGHLAAYYRNYALGWWTTPPTDGAGSPLGG